MKNRESLIQNIKNCGQMLIADAEKIADDCENGNIIITCHVNDGSGYQRVSISEGE